MISHAMKITKKVIHHLNPEQVPVMVADQPLDAISQTGTVVLARDSKRGQISNIDGRLTYRNEFVEVISFREVAGHQHSLKLTLPLLVVQIE